MMYVYAIVFYEKKKRMMELILFFFFCSPENGQWSRTAKPAHGHWTFAVPFPILQFVQEFPSTSIRFVKCLHYVNQIIYTYTYDTYTYYLYR